MSHSITEPRKREVWRKLARAIRGYDALKKGWASPEKVYLRRRARDFRWRLWCEVGQYAINHRMMFELNHATVKVDRVGGLLYRTHIRSTSGAVFVGISTTRDLALVVAENEMMEFYSRR